MVQLEEMLQDPSFVSYISDFTPNRKALTKSTVSAAPASTTKELAPPPAQTPPPPKLSKDTTNLKLDEIIPLDKKEAFCRYRDGGIWGTSELLRGSSAKKAKN